MQVSGREKGWGLWGPQLARARQALPRTPLQAPKVTGSRPAPPDPGLLPFGGSTHQTYLKVDGPENAQRRVCPVQLVTKETVKQYQHRFQLKK